MPDDAQGGRVLVLSRAVVEQLLTMSAAIDIVRTAVTEYSAGRANVPPRPHLVTRDPAGEFLVMPAYMPDMHAAGVKVWSRFEFAGGQVTSALLLYRDLERDIEVVMDAGHVTDVRTGALSGLACQLLAPPGARRLALIGTGLQARTQLDAVLATTSVDDVGVWSRTTAKANSFAAEARLRHPDRDIHVAQSARAAVASADIVVAATTSSTVVIDDDCVQDHALVCGIGSHTRATAEIDPRTVARAEIVVVDSRQGALTGAGDIAQPIEDGLIAESSVVELGELATQSAPRNFTSPAVFKSVGFGALDVAAAKAVTDAAISAGIGQWIELH